MSERIVLELNHVSKIIENEKRKTVILTDVSLSLERGTVTAIMGKSGSGKSTLLSVASGIDAPSKGSVKICGKEFYRLPVKEQQCFRNENIGLLFQNYHLIPELTCEENIRMPKCFSKTPMDEKNLREWMQIVGLEKKRNLFPKQMSGGEQQRTAILRAIVNRPALLFADEPTGALDFDTGNRIIRFLITYAHKMNMAILPATHDRDIAKQCDKVIEICDGRIR